VTKERTFQSVKRWIETIKEQADPNIVIFLVGNKIDQRYEEQVNLADVRKFANNNGVFVEEVSALTGQNVEETFMKLI
jgi:GTPase SAR1 family protein